MANDFFTHSLFFGVLVSLIGYEAGQYLKRKTGLAIVNPLLVAIVFVIAVLLLFHIDYDAYQTGGVYLNYLLTPATVCLAVPLYKQIHLLRQYGWAILLSVFTGTVTSLLGVFLLSVLFHLDHAMYVTLLPKSITTAIGMGMSEELGGIVNITVAVIVVTGVTGNVIGEWVLKVFHVKDRIAKGLALGTSAHAIGTSKAMEMGEIEGAMSSLSIVVAGLLTVIGANVFAIFY